MKNRKNKMNSFQKSKIQKQKITALHTDEARNEEPIIELIEEQDLTMEEADERLFAIIKRDYPNIQENSLNEFNFYVIAPNKHCAMKCVRLIKNVIENIKAYNASWVVLRRVSEKECTVRTTFMEFPFNLDEIGRCAKLFAEAAKISGCEYDGWEIGISNNK
jgi:hypothetical protein